MQLEELEWQWMQLHDMRPELLYRLMELRVSVFVVEQQCPYPELDGQDIEAWHLLGLEAGLPQACLRVLLPGQTSSAYRIGRVAVSIRHRGAGLARQMILLALSRITEAGDGSMVELDAQTYLIPFYQSLGFRQAGDEFLEDGIPHVPMVLGSSHE